MLADSQDQSEMRNIFLDITNVRKFLIHLRTPFNSPLFSIRVRLDNYQAVNQSQACPSTRVQGALDQSLESLSNNPNQESVRKMVRPFQLPPAFHTPKHFGRNGLALSLCPRQSPASLPTPPTPLPLEAFNSPHFSLQPLFTCKPS